MANNLHAPTNFAAHQPSTSSTPSPSPAPAFQRPHLPFLDLASSHTSLSSPSKPLTPRQARRSTPNAWLAHHSPHYAVDDGSPLGGKAVAKKSSREFFKRFSLRGGGNESRKGKERLEDGKWFDENDEDILKEDDELEEEDDMTPPQKHLGRSGLRMSLGGLTPGITLTPKRSFERRRSSLATLDPRGSPVPESRYQSLPDIWYLVDGSELGIDVDAWFESAADAGPLRKGSSRSLSGEDLDPDLPRWKDWRQRQRDYLADLRYMEEAIQYLQSLDPVYPFDHLPMEQQPTNTHLGAHHSSDSPSSSKTRLETAKIQPFTNVLRRIHRPEIDFGMIENAVEYLDWLQEFDDRYTDYLELCGPMLQNLWSSRSPLSFIQSSSLALLSSLDCARFLLYNLAWPRAVWKEVTNLRLEWDQGVWEIEEGIQWAEDGLREAIKVISDDTQPEETFNSGISDKEKKGNVLASSAVTGQLKSTSTQPSLADRLSLLQHLTKVRLPELHTLTSQLLSLLSPCRGIRLVPPEAEHPKDTQNRLLHAERKVDVLKAPVEAWRILHELERRLDTLQKSIEGISAVSEGWERAATIRQELKETQRQALQLITAIQTLQSTQNPSSRSIRILSAKQSQLQARSLIYDPGLVNIEDNFSVPSDLGFTSENVNARNEALLQQLDVESRRAAMTLRQMGLKMGQLPQPEAGSEEDVEDIDAVVGKVRGLQSIGTRILSSVKEDLDRFSASELDGHPASTGPNSVSMKEFVMEIDKGMEVLEYESAQAQILLVGMDDSHHLLEMKQLFSQARTSLVEARSVVIANRERYEVMEIARGIQSSSSEIRQTILNIHQSMLSAIHAVQTDSPGSWELSESLSHSTDVLPIFQSQYDETVKLPLLNSLSKLQDCSPKLARHLARERDDLGKLLADSWNAIDALERLKMQKLEMERVLNQADLISSSLAAHFLSNLSPAASITGHRQDMQQKHIEESGNLLQQLERRISEIPMIATQATVAAFGANPQNSPSSWNDEGELRRRLDEQRTLTPPVSAGIGVEDSYSSPGSDIRFSPPATLTAASPLSQLLMDGDEKIRKKLNSTVLDLRNKLEKARNDNLAGYVDISDLADDNILPDPTVSPNPFVTPIKNNAHFKASEGDLGVPRRASNVSLAEPSINKKDVRDNHSVPQSASDTLLLLAPPNIDTLGSKPYFTEPKSRSVSAKVNRDVKPHPQLHNAVLSAVNILTSSKVSATPISNPTVVDHKFIEGKYLFSYGDREANRFCRIILGQDDITVMVRVGGGFEPLIDFINNFFATVINRSNLERIAPDTPHAQLIGFDMQHGDLLEHLVKQRRRDSVSSTGSLPHPVSGTPQSGIFSMRLSNTPEGGNHRGGSPASLTSQAHSLFSSPLAVKSALPDLELLRQEEEESVWGSSPMSKTHTKSRSTSQASLGKSIVQRKSKRELASKQ